MCKFMERIFVSKEMLTTLGEFTILWAEFELVYCNNNCVDKLFFNDKEFNQFTKLCPTRRIKQYIENRQKFFRFCNFDLEYKTLSEQVISSLLDYLGKTKDTITPEIIHEKLYSADFTSYYPQIDNIICNDIIDNKELLLGCLLIIFRLRNNMFHGLKDCYSINKQLKIFKACNVFLDFLLNN